MKIIFFGSKKLGLTILSLVIRSMTENDDLRVVHFDDESDGRSELPRFQQLCESRGVKLHVTSAATDILDLPEFLGSFQGHNVAIVCGWYSMLPRSILKLFEHGVWGIHHSLLPSYKGGAPLVWQILNNEPKVGTSVFRLEAGVDSGPILAQYDVQNLPSDHIGTLLEKLESKLIENASEWLAPILSGSAEPKEQGPEEFPTQYRMRSASDNTLNLSESSLSELSRYARALNSPYPGLGLRADCGCSFSGVQVSDLRTSLQSGDFVCADGGFVTVSEDRRVGFCGSLHRT